MAENQCKLCCLRGVRSKLITRQLNFEEAITVCENDECMYPLVDFSQVSRNVVKRRASDVSNFKRKKRKRVQKEKPEDSVYNESLVEEDISVNKKILQWQNKSAFCWLDCILSLIVHNRALARCLLKTGKQEDSLLQTLVSRWNDAQSLVLREQATAVRILEEVREQVWQYIQPIMKCKIGVNDSPVAALPILLRENEIVEKKLSQHYQWEFSCSVCGYRQLDRNKKCVATFPNTTSDFSLPNSMFFLRCCYRCGAADQKSQFIYSKQPECMMLHFSEGLKRSDWLDDEFQLGSDKYAVCHLIQYRQNPDHFVFWTKEPNGTKWMELDDLKSPLCSWTTSQPLESPGQVYMAVWEKVFNKNKVTENVDGNKKTKQFKAVSSDASFNLDISSEVGILEGRESSKSSPLVESKTFEDLNSTSHSDVFLTSEDSRVSVVSTPSLPETNQLTKLKSISENSVTMSSRNASHTQLKAKSEHTLRCNSDLVQKLHPSSVLLQNTFQLEDNLDKASIGDSPAIKYSSGTRTGLHTSKRSLQSCGTEKSTSVSMNLIPAVVTPHLTKSISDLSAQSLPVQTNSRNIVHGVFPIKRKLTAAQFEPYIPGKRKVETNMSPSSFISAEAATKDLSTNKSDHNLQPDNTGQYSKKSSFLSWQEIAECGHRDIPAYDSQSDSGYSSPPSVSSCSSSTVLSDCGISDAPSPELHSIKEGAGMNKSISDFGNVSSKLEELLIGGVDSTLMTTMVPDSTGGDIGSLQIEEYKELTEDDNDFLLDLVFS